MKPEIKKLWLRALRSGQYKQGRHVLKTERGTFCCLGVLCDLHAKATGQKWNDRKDDSATYGHGSVTYYPPPAVRKWAGLKDPKGKLPVATKYPDLATANDRGARFVTIANLIEKYL